MLKKKLGITWDELNGELAFFFFFFWFGENSAQKSEQKCLSKNVLLKNSSGKLAEVT